MWTSRTVSSGAWANVGGVYRSLMLLTLFLLELCALAALSWAGFSLNAPLGVRIALGVGLPLLGAVVWGLFAAPRAKVRLSPGAVTTVKVIVYGAATLALFAIGHELLAVAFPVVVLLVTGLIKAGKLDEGLHDQSS